MNEEIAAEAEQFLFWVYIMGFRCSVEHGRNTYFYQGHGSSYLLKVCKTNTSVPIHQSIVFLICGAASAVKSDRSRQVSKSVSTTDIDA